MSLPREGSINAKVRSYLLTGRALTPVEAMANFNTMRLAPRIDDLRKKYGMDIRTTVKRNPTTGSKYASYSLVPQFDIRDRVQVIDMEASYEHALNDSSNKLWEMGDVGRVIAISDRSIQVQFKDGGRWFVRKEDLEIIEKG